MPRRAVLHRLSWSRLGAAALLGLAGGMVSCSEIQPVAPHDQPITEPTQLYMGLTLNHRAITMSTEAPYNTLQLTATPRDALGNPMSGLPAPTYRSTDTTAVRVTAEGLVTAVGTALGVKVIAELTAGPVRHVDEAVINVTALASPPKLASLSIHPVPPDSAVLGMYFEDVYYHDVYSDLPLSTTFNLYGFYLLSFHLPYHNLTPRALDSTGAAIEGLQIEYTSLDSAVATVAQEGIVALFRAGSVRLVARTTAYGITKADTVTFRVLAPLARTINMYPRSTGVREFEPPEVRIPPYGMVTWANYLPDSLDVVFDDPTNVVSPVDTVCFDLVRFRDGTCGTGNALIRPGLVFPDEPIFPSNQARQFPVPGVYPFHSVRTGARGRVVVTADPSGGFTDPD